MAKPDTFTLITICRNAAATVRRTVESIAAQTLPPAEYIFVDGQSTDGTVAILEECRPMLEARGIACHILEQHCPPGAAGIPDAWNQGLAVAAGDVIGLLNADDWYVPETVETVMAAFKDDAECEAVVCPVAFRDAAGDVKWHFRWHALSQLPWRMTLPHPGTFFRRSVYERLGRYDTAYRISADYDFVWRCRSAGVKWKLLEKPLVNMQDGGAADTGRALARRETLAIARKYSSWWDVRPYLAWTIRRMTGK